MEVQLYRDGEGALLLRRILRHVAAWSLTQLMSSLVPGSIRHTAHNNLQNLRNVYVKINMCKHIYR